MPMERLRELARDPHSVTPKHLWSVLTRSERTQAIHAALDDRNPEWLRGYLSKLLVDKIGGFRLATVLGWDNEKLASMASKQQIDGPAIHRAAIIAFHMRYRRELQVAFLDRVGLAHEEGLYDPDNYDNPAASHEHLRAGADHLFQVFPPDHALLYLLGTFCIDPERWAGLEAWLRGSADSPGDAASPMATGPADHVAPRGEQSEAEPLNPLASGDTLEAQPAALPTSDATPLRINSELAKLSILDQHLILTLVDAGAGVAGALSHEQVDALLTEFVSLNGRRHQSFFHLGFRDVLFGRSVPQSLPAANRERWRWYFAGYLTGLRRLDGFDRIVGLFETNSIVTGLGDTGSGPSGKAAYHVFEALCHTGRYAEATNFVAVEAIYESEELAAQVLKVGTELLRREDTALARPLFDLLYQALGRRMADEQDVDPKTWSDVRRRRAHCLRFGDNLEGARALLEELREDPDPESRAAVLADLGLSDSGYRRLFELKYPHAVGDIEDVRVALRRGEQCFRDAIEIEGASTSAHGHYAIGFLELLQERYDSAAWHLDIAVAAFDARPDVYSGGNLLVRARLHLALAICHSLSDIQRLPRARDWILDAIRGGERLPEYLIASTVEALSIVDSEVARDTADAILASTGESVLDVLIGSTVAARSVPIVDSLLRRTEDRGRSVVRRVKDGHHVLPLLLAQQRNDEAARVLDFLETSARQGIETDRFLRVLEDPAAYHPAWDLEDARWALVQCLEARGNYQAAAAILAGEFHRVLSEEGFAGTISAAEIIDRLQGYGQLGADLVNVLRPRYESCCFADPNGNGDGGHVDGNGRSLLSGLRILVVGGDERQEQYDEAIRCELEESHGLRVSFLHTGWSSNWGDKVAELERRIPAIDAIVFSRFMRTEFGRQARKRCGATPWRGCGGSGKRSFINSILAAAGAALRGR